jgi:serine/threonine-protein kinase HipA
LFGVFNDSLPDGWGALLIDRWLRKQQVDPATLSVLDRLSLVGSHTTGALTYTPDRGVKVSDTAPDIDLLAAEVQKVLVDSADADLEKLIRRGESSAGARPKVMVTLDNTGWLIKFRAASDPADIGFLEFNYSQIARKCGIEIPETRLFSGKYFGVKRFDREGDKRLHVHLASGLLYDSHRYPSLDYTSLIKATMALTRDMEECFRLFRLMVFNILTGNRDDHARNFSFIYDKTRWRVSPAYDLVKSSGFNGYHSTTVAGSGNPGRKEIFMVAEECSLPKKQAKVIFDEVFENAGDLICIKI